MGVLAQALRWPGAILATLMLLVWNRYQRERLDIKPHLKYLWGFISIGAAISGLAILTGDAEDLFFILYFETFPEHWHGNFNPLDLLKRIPIFFASWTMYTGGTLILSVPFLFNKHNKSLTPILGTMILYGLLLGTIDHHPSHYFLPLVACTGPVFVASATCLTNPTHQRFYCTIGIIGILVYLWFGIV